MHNHHSHTADIQPASTHPLKRALTVVLAIVILEVVGGWLSNSLALLGDAGHMFVDGLALGLALFAITIAARPATSTRTFGYHRAEILAALANGIVLVLVAGYIFYEAYRRFLEPPEVHTGLMLPVAAVGLVANIAMVAMLSKSSRQNLNIKAAVWHIIGDTVSSLGVIIGGIVIILTGWYAVDSIIAIFVGLVILIGAVRLVRESVDILLESVPSHIQMGELVESMTGISGVEGVHDVHIWTITSGVNAMSAHVLIEDQAVSQSADILDTLSKILAERFNISHTTLQLECEICENCPSSIICNISRRRDRSTMD